MLLKIKPVNDEVKVFYEEKLKQHHKGDSGLDLFVVEDAEIKAGETVFLKLGFMASAWDGDKNISWLLLPRSSIAKTPLRLSNSMGLIDAGYRGEVMAAVDNIKEVSHSVKKGDRLFQAVSFSGDEVNFEIVESLDETTRGAGGFGSTNAN